MGTKCTLGAGLLIVSFTACSDDPTRVEAEPTVAEELQAALEGRVGRAPGSIWGYTTLGMYLPDHGVTVTLMVHVGAREASDAIIESVSSALRDTLLERIA